MATTYLLSPRATTPSKFTYLHTCVLTDLLAYLLDDVACVQCRDEPSGSVSPLESSATRQRQWTLSIVLRDKNRRTQNSLQPKRPTLEYGPSVTRVSQGQDSAPRRQIYLDLRHPPVLQSRRRKEH